MQAHELLTSDKFKPFQSDSFDAAEFASRSLQSESHTTAQAQTEQLQAGVTALDAALRQLVLQHQGELIAQTARLTEAESAVQRIGLSVRSLQMVAARVKAEVAEPYQVVATQTRQLMNLQATVDLLRHVTHRLKLVQKLRQQMAAADGAGEVEQGLALCQQSNCGTPLWAALFVRMCSCFRDTTSLLFTPQPAVECCVGNGSRCVPVQQVNQHFSVGCLLPPLIVLPSSLLLPAPRRRAGGCQGSQAAV